MGWLRGGWRAWNGARPGSMPALEVDAGLVLQIFQKQITHTPHHTLEELTVYISYHFGGFTVF